MTQVEAFLNDAAALAGTTVDEVLARVLHVDTSALAELLDGMDEQVRHLAIRLDREVRVRNPGVHYVMRTKFVGYRREGAAVTPAGERSQIFLSVVRMRSRLEVVLPVDTGSLVRYRNAEDLRGRGHHGVGDVRVSMRSDSDVDRFLLDFDEWLMPRTPF